ncbi:ATP binding cassette subfamily B19 [Actinidia rufa]|uniref:ATP binding cassette subfamily B19 n=1 Tax=Actinidia rufa TaxID=165716 RepID=A0A7J0H221_9ERIC|nr:ATP binding cassette subfamily B19 [Actinidia rufa]
MSGQLGPIPGPEDDSKAKDIQGKKKPQRVSLMKLFAFADAYDCFLMFVGSIGACVHGASVPVFFVFFGKIINTIGMAYLYPAAASHRVAKVCNSENAHAK